MDYKYYKKLKLAEGISLIRNFKNSLSPKKVFWLKRFFEILRIDLAQKGLFSYSKIFLIYAGIHEGVSEYTV